MKQTRIYRDAVEEGKQEGKPDMAPLFVPSGWSVERIAQEFSLDVEAVRKAALGGANGANGNGQAG